MRTSEPRATLPPPESPAAAHSERLRARLVDEITCDGPLRFDRYWDRVLYEPGLGYYAAGAVKFGAAGDFVTAPELGPVFARCCAEPIAGVLQALGGGEVLEFGAGSGAFAAAVLERLAELDRLPKRYLILERSADLAERQRSALRQRVPTLVDRVHWLDGLPRSPWRGVVFANEVLDALAPRRVRWRAGEWSELHVGLDEGGALCWVPRPLPPELEPEVERLPLLWDREPAGDWITELQPTLGPWVAAAAEQLAAGAVVLCDYGYAEREYFHRDRHDGTLIAHYRHRALADPFFLPGLVDLSVSVDFGRVARALEAAGLDPAGCVSQASFLLATALPREAEAALALPEREKLARMNEIRRLTLPSQMGERFRLIAAVRGLRPDLAGFSGAHWLAV